MSVNKVILVGNVGKDPEIRYLEGGTAVCKFPLATSEVYKNRNGEKVENTEWHNIVLWRGLAEIAEKYVKKGSQLFIEGRIRTRSYTDKEGITRYTTEITADTMQMLGRKSDEGSQGNYGSGQTASAAPKPAEQASSNPSAPNQPSTSQASQENPAQEKPFEDLNDGSSNETDDLPF